MSNWQPSFNLDAPEFVPKFGNSAGQAPPQQQQQQNQPRMYAPPPAGVAPPGHPYYNQFPGQQQQQFYQMPPNQFRQPFQGQPNQPQQQLSPPQPQPQQQQPISPSQPAPVAATKPSDQEVNKLAANLSQKLNTESDVKPETKTPTAQSPSIEPSVEKEKSVAPSVAAIKEQDEDWEKEESVGMEEDGETATGEAAEGSAKPKKQIVIREYKPKKEPVNVIFCGHVDAGKSTIGGQIMHLTGMVDKRTLEKYEREAKEKNRETWYLSWALDTNIEEREKGKTVEVGRAFFETEKRHFIILDAPGHRGFVPNMIGGAAQADVAVLVISARRGEFETGFERGGQTREHAMLVKTAGVKYLIVLVNKMDDPTVNWDQARYDDIKEKLSPYLKKCGFQPGKDTFFMPCSGYTGAFIKEPADESIVPWYRGPCFIETLDSLPALNRTLDGPVRMPIIDKYKDMGTLIMGKIESGTIRLNDKFCVMPNKVKVEVVNIYCEEDETDSAICGENVKLKLKGIEEEEISSGFVLCDPKDVCHVAKVFDAQVVILDYPSIICPGFNSIMHLHTSTVEIQLKAIIGMVDKKSGERDLKNRPRFIKQDQIAICRFEVLGGNIVCVEPFKLFPQLGRFTLRYETKTVAIGKVLKIIE